MKFSCKKRYDRLLPLKHGQTHGHVGISMTPIDQTVHHSPLIHHRRAVGNVLPLLRCSLSSTTTAKTTHKHPVMNTGDVYQLLLPGDNRKILLTGVNLNEVVKWTTLVSSEFRLNKLLILYETTFPSSFIIITPRSRKTKPGGHVDAQPSGPRLCCSPF